MKTKTIPTTGGLRMAVKLVRHMLRLSLLWEGHASDKYKILAPIKNNRRQAEDWCEFLAVVWDTSDKIPYLHVFMTDDPLGYKGHKRRSWRFETTLN